MITEIREEKLKELRENLSETEAKEIDSQSRKTAIFFTSIYAFCAFLILIVFLSVAKTNILFSAFLTVIFLFFAVFSERAYSSYKYYKTLS